MMKRLSATFFSLLLSVIALVGSAAAQTFETVGTRAKGMGGAHVAAVEDASAAYWNPAGFASGAYFSLVVDWSKTTQIPPEAPVASRQDGLLFALGAPAFGLTYYQLESTALRTEPPAVLEPVGRDIAGDVRVVTVKTHHFGGTLVQSLFPGVAVGATLKYVRARAGLDLRPDGDRDALLADGAPLADQSDREFDTDIGAMAVAGRVKVGFTMRNLLEPRFQVTADGEQVQLQRQARLGLALKPANLTIAMDFDLLKTMGPFGEVKDFALGGEARFARRVFVRGGFHMNTLSLPEVGHAPAYGFGGSFGLTASVFVDGQVTTGSDKASSGWGISGRVLY